MDKQLSRYGALSRVILDLAPGSKLFLVCDSDDTTVGPINLGAVYPVDGDGVARVYTTIQAAVTAASAGRGDVVAVLPGFDYNLAGADSWNKAGVNVIGLGSGGSIPIIRYTATGSTIDVGANNVHIKNLRFIASVDSVTRGLDLDSGFSGAVVEGCVFDYDTNADNFTTMLRVAQKNSVIQDNEFRAEDTAGTGKGVELLGGYADFLKVRRNFFYGQFDTVGDTTNNAAAIAIAVVHDSGDTVLSGVEISENTIVSTDTAAAVLINLDPTALGAPRGVVRDNRLVSYDTATADTAQVNFGTTGGFLALNNWFIDGDSDVPESFVGRQNKLPGLQDS
jgi:hypothetical protein